MPKREVNPCKSKGRYQRKHSGRRYRHGISFTACECSKPFPSIAPQEFEAVGYAMGTEKSGTPGKLMAVKRNEKNPLNSFCVVPCNEAFRYTKSRGTKKFRKLFGEGSLFRGCQKIEEELIRGKLISTKPIESVSTDDILVEGIQHEDTFIIPDTDKLLTSYAEKAAFLMELAIDADKRERVKTAPQFPSIASPLAGVIGPAPVDLWDSKLRDLYDSGHFDEDPKLKVAAFLMTRYLDKSHHRYNEFNEEHHVLRIAPAFPIAELPACKAKVSRIVGKVMSERARKFETFIKGLTPKQLATIKAVYLENDGLTQEEVARKLGISFSSLRDRLRGIKQGLISHFNPLVPVESRSERSTSDLQNDGFYRVSSSKRRGPIRQTNVKTGEVSEIFPPNDEKNVAWIAPWGPPKPRDIKDRAKFKAWLDGSGARNTTHKK